MSSAAISVLLVLFKNLLIDAIMETKYKICNKKKKWKNKENSKNVYKIVSSCIFSFQVMFSSFHLSMSRMLVITKRGL